ncbi:16S rRNA (guanine(527)-N(7))-methyltransferase RsmG [Adlercreutzia sp. R21]|uniref:16S rRNA (guanine(527)-N(7))-methyltransferase RsmG n=1 Tax=Adlercreutzia wanghongyangiae TaxID=3111451 RepID=UPI002DBDFEDF|nr:16S rRNA (guanine(527)-N(7))-methyltransferase RsmG [Adlercreutzia sp. R21]MEC4184494.1 16S rRNA (guanine(527)-N(7))-methyltransferase RsmG [Adlercreutzia sp. R21]
MAMSEHMVNDLAQQYLDLVLEANKTINLTRITNRDEAEVLHLEDSLVGLDEVNEAPAGLYGDLGSGGGFPGVPLALATGRETVLVDSVKKKMAVVSQLIDQLGLSNQITTCDDRIEDLALDRPGSFSVLTARALSRLVSLLELSSPLLVRGGRLVCYKAQVSDEELNEALAVQDLLGMKLISERKTLLSDGETARTILVFEKMARARLKLPRRVGAAQKTPLKPRP